MRIIVILFLGTIAIGSVKAQVRDDLYDVPSTKKQADLPDSIPKGVSKIIIHNKLNKAENFQFIGEKLIEKDFQIERSNKDFWTISTVPRAHDRINFDYILNFIAKDSAIVITGTLNLNVGIILSNVEIQPSNSKIENRGTKNSPLRLAFVEMYKFAATLADDSVVKFIVE